MKGRRVKPSDHLLLGLSIITLEVGVTWYYYLKNKLRQNKKEEPKTVPISDDAFEEELDRASASNGNGTVEQDKPCPCEDEPIPPSPDLSETEEESESPVTSLPGDESEEPGLVKPETPETDTH